MTLDDLTEDVKEKAKEELENSRLEEVSEELGVENLEDLEELDRRIDSMATRINIHGKRIEELSDDMTIIKKALRSILEEVEE